MFACLYQLPPSSARDDSERPQEGTPPSGEPREPRTSSSATGSPASAAAATALVALALDCSPRYEVYSDALVVVDISGLERLLGPPYVVGDELRRAALTRGLRVQIAIARTQAAAVVLALTQPGVTVVEADAEATALAQVPIGVLNREEVSRLDAEASTPKAQSSARDEASAVKLETFERWGIKTLGQLAELPAADLLSRLGRAALAWQAIARGEDLRPLIPTLDAERFESTLELEWPIEGLEPLSFVLTRLLEPLSTQLERRDRGAAVLHVLLRLVTREVYARRLELPAPMREIRALRTLALLDLEAHPPPAAIDRVTIVIDPTPGRVLQHTLFTRAQPTPEQLSTLLARIGALMGQDRFGCPTRVDTDRPGAFGVKPFATERRGGVEDRRRGAAPAPGKTADDKLPSALRRCRQPVPARVAVVDCRPVRVTSDRRGFTGGAVAHCAGPWRTSGEWWTTSRWVHDEWEVALADGAVYRVFQDRETGGWFIEAIVD